jgi:hypothetical protein
VSVDRLNRRRRRFLRKKHSRRRRDSKNFENFRAAAVTADKKLTQPTQ